MGIGPTLAIPKLLELTGVEQSEVDLFEINEAFTSMAVYCEEKLNINSEILNVNGGATALGHPLGSVSKEIRSAEVDLSGREKGSVDDV